MELAKEEQQGLGVVIRELSILEEEVVAELLIRMAIMELVVIMAAVTVECINMGILLQY